MKGKGFLKVTSILMIIGGVLAAIVGIIGLLGLGVAHSIAGDLGVAGDVASDLVMAYASIILVIVASIIEFISGIKGIGACSAPEKAAACVKWGIIVAVLSVVSIILNLVGGGEFNVMNLVLNLVLPALYVLGAVQMKNSLTEQNTQGA